MGDGGEIFRRVFVVLVAEMDQVPFDVGEDLVEGFFGVGFGRVRGG